MRYLKENTAQQVTVGPFYDVTDAITPELALTATNEFVTFIVDDLGVSTLVYDAVATVAGSNDLVHITSDAGGYYSFELTAANTNYTGRACLSIVYATDHLPVFHEFQILSANVYDSLFTDGDVLDVSVTQVSGVAEDLPTATAVAAIDTTIGVAGAGLTNLGASGNNWNVGKTGYTLTATTGLGAQTANITGNLSGTVGSVTGAVGSVTNHTNQTGDTYALLNSADSEPAQGTPSHTASLAVKIATIFKFMVNKKTATSTTISVFNSDESTVDVKSTISDDATTYTEGEYTSGP